MSAATVAIRSALEGLSGLPVPVRVWHIIEGRDSTDDPAVWVWAVIDEADFNRETSLQITDAAAAAVRVAAPGLSPYVLMRGLHEDPPTA